MRRIIGKIDKIIGEGVDIGRTVELFDMKVFIPSYIQFIFALGEIGDAFCGIIIQTPAIIFPNLNTI